MSCVTFGDTEAEDGYQLRTIGSSYLSGQRRDNYVKEKLLQDRCLFLLLTREHPVLLAVDSFCMHLILLAVIYTSLRKDLQHSAAYACGCKLTRMLACRIETEFCRSPSTSGGTRCSADLTRAKLCPCHLSSDRRMSIAETSTNDIQVCQKHTSNRSRILPCSR